METITLRRDYVQHLADFLKDLSDDLPFDSPHHQMVDTGLMYLEEELEAQRPA